MQSAHAPIVGIASLPLPHAQQVVIAALDSQGFLHIFATPLPANVVVWDSQTESPAAELAASAQQGSVRSVLGASRESGASQDPERAAGSASTGELD